MDLLRNNATMPPTGEPFMTTRGLITSPLLVALLGITIVFLASSCGQSTTAAKLSAPSAAAGFPSGGPVPAQLLGAWFMPPAAVEAVSGVACPSPPSATNCFFQLTLLAKTYYQAYTASGGKQAAGQGNVVVNNNEIDFFNGAMCGLKLPDGIGRYRWTITAGLLYFTLISDPCTRWEVYTHQGWSRSL
jgi:hypothetical protein